MSVVLGDRQCFRRTWVVQEIYAAQDLIFQYGMDQFDASYFAGVEAAKPLLLNRSAINIQQLLSTKRLRTASRPSRRQAEHFFTVLAQGRDREVFDPRDSLYALLGMLNNQHDDAFADLAINYHKSDLELSADLVKYTTQLTDTYQCVADAFTIISMRPLPTTDLPSWLCCLTQYADVAQDQRDELHRKMPKFFKHVMKIPRPGFQLYQHSASDGPLKSNGDASDLPDLSSDYRTLIFRRRFHPNSEQRLDHRHYISSQSQGDFVKLDESISFHQPVSICGASRMIRVAYVFIARTGFQPNDIVVASRRSEEILVLRKAQTLKGGSQNFSIIGVAYIVMRQLDDDFGLCYSNYFHAPGIQLQDTLGMPAWSNGLAHPMSVDRIYADECTYMQSQNEAVLEQHLAEGFPTFSGEEQDFVLV